MNLIYLTSKRYPPTTADHFFVRSMSEAFTKILGGNFSLFISGPIPDELNGINTTSVKAPKHLRLFFYFFWIPTFVVTHKHNTDNTIFFSNDPYLLSILIFFKKLFRLKYKICSDWHQLFNDWRDKYISTNSDFLISTSKNLKNLILDISEINENKILVAYGGVDLNNFQFPISNFQKIREKLGFSESDFLIGYVGFYKTMGMSKGLDTMISALALIPNKNVKMVFVGGKSGEIEEYKTQADILGVGNRAIFVPVVPNSAISAYEACMDVLVIPYPNKPHFRDYGFPMKVYEYMASRRPIIYSNLPIITEILSDCATSFNPDNAHDLTIKIKNLIANPEEGIKLADNAYAKVKDFTWEKRAENIIAFLKKT